MVSHSGDEVMPVIHTETLRTPPDYLLSPFLAYSFTCVCVHVPCIHTHAIELV